MPVEVLVAYRLIFLTEWFLDSLQEFLVVPRQLGLLMGVFLLADQVQGENPLIFRILAVAIKEHL